MKTKTISPQEFLFGLPVNHNLEFIGNIEKYPVAFNKMTNEVMCKNQVVELKDLIEHYRLSHKNDTYRGIIYTPTAPKGLPFTRTKGSYYIGCLNMSKDKIEELKNNIKKVKNVN